MKKTFSKLSIVIDTREQRPWAFPSELVDSRRGTLPTGDYALAGDLNFAIERKSVADFLGTVIVGWERFCREIERMEYAGFPAKIIIVEGTFDDVLPLCGYYDAHPKVSPAFVLSRIAKLSLSGVAVLFCGDAPSAAATAVAILRERKKQCRSELNEY